MGNNFGYTGPPGGQLDSDGGVIHGGQAWYTQSGINQQQQLASAQEQLKLLKGGQGKQQFQGMGYQQMGQVPGVPGAFQGEGGVGSEAQMVLQASSGAEAAMRRGYEAMLREQAGQVGGAQMEDQRRSASQLGQAGVSPLLQHLISRNRRTMAQGQAGAGLAGATNEYEGKLAQLIKGTGSELAGIKQHETGSLLNAYVGEKTADASHGGGGLGDLAGLASIASLFI